MANALAEDAALAAEKPSAPLSLSRQGAWFIADSQNFQVCSLRNFAEAQAAALYCEAQRAVLINKWNAPAVSRAWSPRCQVVLHNSFEGYVRAVYKVFVALYEKRLIYRDKYMVS